MCVRYLGFDCHVFEFAVAFTAAAEIDPQRSDAVLCEHRRSSPKQAFLDCFRTPFVAAAGETVKHQDDRRIRDIIRRDHRAYDCLAFDLELDDGLLGLRRN